ncbi:MAG: tRNA (adenosine(37)-N6)-dimethylallyltransferase MiaA [Bdellovibrionales bacterium]|nr:tRNA (adenosine(37)-N6)-dimethylallyltransferase MiaA [Bdellovibrionales bacterium]
MRRVSPAVAILTGPTSSGKTALAVELAQGRGIEILNADSVSVYRGMNVGAAKPSAEERARVSHHLLDLRDPDQPFTAGDFVAAVAEKLEELHSEGKRALIVGGTGFYLKALLFGTWAAGKPDAAFRASLDSIPAGQLHARLNEVDPRSALRISARDRYRLVRALEILHQTGRTPSALEAEMPSKPVEGLRLWVIDRPETELRDRIRLRTEQMIRDGILDETQSLIARFPGARALHAVGYAQTADFLAGRPPEGRKIRAGIAGLGDEIDLATRQLVKRQRTWFKNLRARLPDPVSRGYLLESELPALRRDFLELYGA